MEDRVGVAARLGEIERPFERVQGTVLVVEAVAGHRLDHACLDRR